MFHRLPLIYTTIFFGGYLHMTCEHFQTHEMCLINVVLLFPGISSSYWSNFSKSYRATRSLSAFTRRAWKKVWGDGVSLVEKSPYLIILIHKCRHQVNEVTVRKMKILSQYWVTDTGHSVQNNSMDTFCFSSAWLLFVLLLQTEKQRVSKWSAQWCHVVTRESRRFVLTLFMRITPLSGQHTCQEEVKWSCQDDQNLMK